MSAPQQHSSAHPGSSRDEQLLFQLEQVTAAEGTECLLVGSRQVPVRFIRNEKARRYILRMQPDGSARVTIPSRGSKREAQAFAHRHLDWVAAQLEKQATVRQRKPWQHGNRILFRGEMAALAVDVRDGATWIEFGDQRFRLKSAVPDLRPIVEAYLRTLAAAELPLRAWELAQTHAVAMRRVSVRDQRSRWGSCSVRGTVSLNWRLIQTPDFVRDYIILHELMHLREMNHSARFWKHVELVCPDYLTAERWLKRNGALLWSGAS